MSISEVGQKVLKSANELVAAGTVGTDCWNWVAQVYQRIGLYDDLNRGMSPTFFSDIFVGSAYGGGSQRNLENNELEMIIPGDWLYIHNGNTYDPGGKGNHSVIFLGWTRKAEGWANFAWSPFAGKPGQIGERNLFNEPVERVYRVNGNYASPDSGWDNTSAETPDYSLYGGSGSDGGMGGFSIGLFALLVIGGYFILRGK